MEATRIHYFYHVGHSLIPAKRWLKIYSSIHDQIYGPYEKDRYLIGTVLKFLSNETILLDYGCGTGWFLRRILRRGRLNYCVGIDISSLSIRKAVGLTPNNLRNKIDYVICDGEHLPFRPFTFDIVVVVKVLHHLSSPSKGLAEIYRVMTKHGKVVLNETLIDHPMILFGRKLIGMYKGKGAKLSSVSLCNLLSGVGFQINEMIAAEYLLTIIHTLVKIIPSLSVLFNREFLLLISKFEKFAFYRFRRMSQDVSITASKKM